MTAPCLALCGPTASGKSQLAMQLAAQFPIEIISVDSAQVYCGLDIGSAKPSAQERAQVAHHLIDIRDPLQPYSAAQFATDAKRLIADIRARGKLPFLVGGTMLYFKALAAGLAPMPTASTELRLQLQREAEQLGWEAMHQRLASIDPAAAARIQVTDAQRIARALEVWYSSGTTLSQWHQQKGETFPLYTLALLPNDRPALQKKIDQRFLAMLEQGLLDEVRRLFARGDLHQDLPAIRSVGYRQAWDYLLGACRLEEFISQAQAASRQLAKRQLTWLRSWPIDCALPAEQPDLALKQARLAIETFCNLPARKALPTRPILSQAPQ